MIRIKDDPISEAYAAYCSPSWEGFNLKYYDAITPETLHLQSGLTFGKKNNRDLTDKEKACLYSQYNLWKKCAVENVPILILEHDAWLEKIGPISFNPYLEVQFFGQHAMEAVMFHPRFAKRLMKHLSENEVKGPMNLVDGLLGYFNKGEQSRYALPHSRFMGRLAPVRSVLDPNIGNTIDHLETVVDRVRKKGDGDLFKLVDLRRSNLIL